MSGINFFKLFTNIGLIRDLNTSPADIAGYLKINFFNTLKQLGFVISEYAFPDHYDFHKVDFEIMDNQPTVMTEKDAIKCSFLDHTNYWYLKIEADVSDNFKEDFLEEIKSK